MIALKHEPCFRGRSNRLRPRVVSAPPNPYEQAAREVAQLAAAQRDRGLAVVLSGIVPGLGQLYQGHTPAGLLMLAAAVALWVFSIMRFPNSSFIPLAIIHFSSALHASGISRL